MNWSNFSRFSGKTIEQISSFKLNIWKFFSIEHLKMFRISDLRIFEWFSDKTIEQDQFFPNFRLNIHFANLVSNPTKTLRVFFSEFITKLLFDIFSKNNFPNLGQSHTILLRVHSDFDIRIGNLCSYFSWVQLSMTCESTYMHNCFSFNFFEYYFVN